MKSNRNNTKINSLEKPSKVDENLTRRKKFIEKVFYYRRSQQIEISNEIKESCLRYINSEETDFLDNLRKNYRIEFSMFLFENLARFLNENSKFQINSLVRKLISDGFEIFLSNELNNCLENKDNSDLKIIFRLIILLQNNEYPGIIFTEEVKKSIENRMDDLIHESQILEYLLESLDFYLYNDDDQLLNLNFEVIDRAISFSQNLNEKCIMMILTAFGKVFYCCNFSDNQIRKYIIFFTKLLDTKNKEIFSDSIYCLYKLLEFNLNQEFIKFVIYNTKFIDNFVNFNEKIIGENSLLLLSLIVTNYFDEELSNFEKVVEMLIIRFEDKKFEKLEFLNLLVLFVKKSLSLSFIVAKNIGKILTNCDYDKDFQEIITNLLNRKEIEIISQLKINDIISILMKFLHSGNYDLIIGALENLLILFEFDIDFIIQFKEINGHILLEGWKMELQSDNNYLDDTENEVFYKILEKVLNYL